MTDYKVTNEMLYELFKEFKGDFNQFKHDVNQRFDQQEHRLDRIETKTNHNFEILKQEISENKKETNHNFEKLFQLIEKREFKLKYTWALTTVFISVFTSFMAVIFAKGLSLYLKSEHVFRRPRASECFIPATNTEEESFDRNK